MDTKKSIPSSGQMGNEPVGYERIRGDKLDEDL
jgi:hypothetical protein